MRKYLFPMLALALAVIAQPKASATSILTGTYALSNATAAGDALSGTVTIGTSGLITSANLSFADAAIGDPSFTNVGTTGAGSTDYAYINGSTGQVLLEYLPTLDASGNLDLCIFGSTCSILQASHIQIYTPFGFNGLGVAALDAGTLNAMSNVSTTTTVTPEPSSLLLLGTGLFGMAIWSVRRSKPQERAAENAA